MQGKDKKKMDIYNIWLLHILKMQKIILKPLFYVSVFISLTKHIFILAVLFFPG